MSKSMDWIVTLIANALVVVLYLLAAKLWMHFTGMELWQGLLVTRLLWEAATQVKTDPKIQNRA